MSEQAILELADQLARKVAAARDSMFSQCCSNPIYNAWGGKVDMTLFNEASELAYELLKMRGQP
ncbi:MULTISPECIES: hypothetical protein [Aeromonas]|uniref:hypothetical protein n=1 Tax=Aeromonas caviae TaxID=648 RepID=UPI0029DCD01D|nr:hypothetical protein [Aeromonas caviae]MDX7711808.1 hypothetical protein [Aeromonas caviae]